LTTDQATTGMTSTPTSPDAVAGKSQTRRKMRSWIKYVRRQIGWRLIIWSNKLRGRSFVPVPWKQVFVEPTSKCNLACRFCSYPLEVRPCRNMGEDAFQRHVDGADRIGIEKVWLTPMTGDVFMDKNIFGKLEALEKSAVKEIAFYTNFVTPEQDDIERLKTIAKLRELHISCYGTTEERFAAITAKPPQHFRRFVRNLGFLADELHDWPSKPRIMIELRESGSFDEATLAEPLAGALQRLRLEHGASVGTVTEYDNWGGLITADHVAGLDIVLTPGQSLYHLGACVQVFLAPMITSSGQVVGCGCRGHDDGLLLGDTKEQPLEEILSSENERWRGLVDGMNKGKFPKVCQSCGMYRSVWDHRWARGTAPERVTTLENALKPRHVDGDS
jgi:hypothetical protein